MQSRRHIPGPGAPAPAGIRVEDILSAGFALALVVFAGTRSALQNLRLDQEKYWELSFIVAPAALLILLASFRYAFARGPTAPGGPVREIAGVLRDWLPFLLFLMAYETFQSRVWELLLPRDRDAQLLAWDRWLFGETPAIPMERLLSPGLTDAMVVAYFLHLVLPPVVAVVWYTRDRRVFREFLLAVLIAGLLGSVGYLAVPAVGPGIAFPNLFREGLRGGVYRPVLEFLDAARAPRDVFPSLHVAVSTIVLYYGGRRGRAWFAVLLPLVLANWFSTVYLRYHYLVDVIAGWATAALACVLARALLRAEEKVRHSRNRVPESAPTR
jgi:membrane-associated phospholipid phosphatase